MDVEEALKILAMSEQERYQNGIVNSVEAIKRVKNEIDFLTRCLEGLKKQILELFHEKKELEKKIEKLADVAERVSLIEERFKTMNTRIDALENDLKQVRNH